MTSIDTLRHTPIAPIPSSVGELEFTLPGPYAARLVKWADGEGIPGYATIVMRAPIPTTRPVGAQTPRGDLPDIPPGYMPEPGQVRHPQWGYLGATRRDVTYEGWVLELTTVQARHEVRLLEGGRIHSRVERRRTDGLYERVEHYYEQADRARAVGYEVPMVGAAVGAAEAAVEETQRLQGALAGDEALAEDLAEVTEQRRHAEALAEQARERQAELIRRSLELGLSARWVAGMVHMSEQRISQIRRGGRL